MRCNSSCFAQLSSYQPHPATAFVAVALVALALGVLVYMRRRKRQPLATLDKPGSSKGLSTESEDCFISMHHRWFVDPFSCC